MIIGPQLLYDAIIAGFIHKSYGLNEIIVDIAYIINYDVYYILYMLNFKF